MSEWYCVVNAQRYGPKPLSELQDWGLRGILKPTDLVWTEGMAEWAPAGTLGQHFTFVTAPPTPTEPGAAPLPPSAGPPGQFPQAPGVAGAVGYLAPHRGTMILVFGILGLVVCCFFGIVAWSMGSNDLREMDAGRMDPSGRSNTNAGRILGIVSVILPLAGLLFYLLAAALGAIAGPLD